MTSYKRYSTALKHANGRPIITVGGYSDRLYIVGSIDTLTEISLTTSDGKYGGFINAGHLNRIGNGNHAEAKRPIANDAFAKVGE